MSHSAQGGDDSPLSQDELQKKMASLVAELQGVMTQMHHGGANGTAAAAAVAAAAAAVGLSPAMQQNLAKEFSQPAADENPFSAFPIPGVSTSLGGSAASSLDQDLARLLQAPDARGGSAPPMDTNKWLTSMLSHVGTTSGGSASSAQPSTAASSQPRRTAPFPAVGSQASSTAGPFTKSTASAHQATNPHGGAFGGYNSNPFGSAEYFPHGRAGIARSYAAMVATPSATVASSASVASTLPPDSAIIASAPSSTKISDVHTPAVSASSTGVPRSAPVVQSATPSSVFSSSGSSASRPFRGQPPQPQIGAPLTAQNSQMLREAFGGYPLLQEVQPLEDDQGRQTSGGVNAAARKPNKIPPSSASRRRPEAPVEEEHMDATMPMAYVEFKRQKIKKYPVDGVITPGQYVIVDGDRGQDCGLLVQITAPTADGKLSVLAMEGSALEDQKLRVEQGRVIRVAEPGEVDMLHNQIAASERNALRACRQKCKEMGLTIEILDCEYQFDMKKISFYFNSDRSVDFRDLVRDLYRSFGARIWMENINPNVKNVVPTGPSAKHH